MTQWKIYSETEQEETPQTKEQEDVFWLEEHLSQWTSSAMPIEEVISSFFAYLDTAMLKELKQSLQNNSGNHSDLLQCLDNLSSNEQIYKMRQQTTLFILYKKLGQFFHIKQLPHWSIYFLSKYLENDVYDPNLWYLLALNLAAIKQFQHIPRLFEIFSQHYNSDCPLYDVLSSYSKQAILILEQKPHLLDCQIEIPTLQIELEIIEKLSLDFLLNILQKPQVKYKISADCFYIKEPEIIEITDGDSAEETPTEPLARRQTRQSLINSNNNNNTKSDPQEAEKKTVEQRRSNWMKKWKRKIQYEKRTDTRIPLSETDHEDIRLIIDYERDPKEVLQIFAYFFFHNLLMYYIFAKKEMPLPSGIFSFFEILLQLKEKDFHDQQWYFFLFKEYFTIGNERLMVKRKSLIETLQSGIDYDICHQLVCLLHWISSCVYELQDDESPLLFQLEPLFVTFLSHLKLLLNLEQDHNHPLYNRYFLLYEKFNQLRNGTS